VSVGDRCAVPIEEDGIERLVSNYRLDTTLYTRPASEDGFSQNGQSPTTEVIGRDPQVPAGYSK
jgi:hypothetical protein